MFFQMRSHIQVFFDLPFHFRFFALRFLQRSSQAILLPLNEAVKGAVVTKEGNDLVYTSQKVEERKFDDIRYYYSPLPYDECVKNPNLVNNLGWK